MYGARLLQGPRQYQTKVRNAQEAHEAIRPTEFRRTPQSLERVLESDELRIYDLIWKRAIASQMADARMLRTTRRDHRHGHRTARRAVLTASGKAIEFAGYLRAYVEGSDDPAAELDEQETLAAEARGRRSDPRARPARRAVRRRRSRRRRAIRRRRRARFTEASLVKRLEEEGIGRPSTYAPTVATIQRRGYVSRQGKALVPSFTAFAVTRLLRDHFGDYVDVGFTAEMEEILDQISNGEKDWLDFIREFYRGDGKHHGLENLVEDKGQEIAYPVIDVCDDPETRLADARPHRPLRSVPAARRDERRRAARVAPGRSRAGRSHVREGARAAQGQGRRAASRSASIPTTGQNVYVMLGRFGAVRAAGRNAGRQEGGEAAPRVARPQLHAKTRITLADALKLLSLPRELGAADDGEVIVANVGRFGPYVKHGDEFRSLEADDDVYTITLERAKELLAQEKKSMRRQRAARQGAARAGRASRSRGAPVRILDGRYGPYVTDGTTNASLPKGTAPEALTMDEAVGLLAAREGAAEGPASPRGEEARRRAREEGREAARDACVHDRASHMIHIIGGGLGGQRSGLAGRRASASRSRFTRCGRCVRRPCTRPTGSPSWCAATRSAATSSITRSVC